MIFLCILYICVCSIYISINERNVDTTELTRLPHSLVTNVNKTQVQEIQQDNKICKSNFDFLPLSSLWFPSPSTFLSSLLSIRPSTFYSAPHLSVTLPLIPPIYPSTFYSSPDLSDTLSLIPFIYPSTFYSSLLSIHQPSTHPSYLSVNLLIHPSYLSVNLPFIPPIFTSTFLSSLLLIHQPSAHLSCPSTFTPSLLSIHQPSTHPFYISVNLLFIPPIYNQSNFHLSLLSLRQRSSHPFYLSINRLLIPPVLQPSNHPSYLSVNLPLIPPIYLSTFHSSPYLFVNLPLILNSSVQTPRGVSRSRRIITRQRGGLFYINCEKLCIWASAKSYFN